MSAAMEWVLVYTKPRCEAWCEAHLRNQGYEVLSPRARTTKGIEQLFPRYVFVGHAPGRATGAVQNTRGVQRVVAFGSLPARVPQDVVDDVRSRIGADGLVRLDESSSGRALFDQRHRERLRALVKLAEAGFKVRAA